MNIKEQVKESLKLGEKQVDIAARLNISQPYVSLIATNKTAYNNRKATAKKNNVLFTIKLEDLEFPEYCPLLGIRLDYQAIKGKGSFDNYPTIDRLDSTKGYIKGNGWIISSRANRIKNDSTIEEMELIVKNLKKVVDLQLSLDI